MAPLNLVRIDYMTLEEGDLVYNEYGEYLGSVNEVSDFVRVNATRYSIYEIESLYTPIRNFYSSTTEKQQDQEESSQQKESPKKVLTSEEIYGMLLSEVSLLGVSKKAVRKIERAVLHKLEKMQ